MPFLVFNKKHIQRGTQDPSGCDDVVDVSRPHCLGNPFTLGHGPDSSRELVIERYRQWLAQRLRAADDPQIRAELLRLGRLDQQGKSIGLLCWCDPLPCHAHVVARAAQYLLRTEQTEAL